MKRFLTIVFLMALVFSSASFAQYSYRAGGEPVDKSMILTPKGDIVLNYVKPDKKDKTLEDPVKCVLFNNLDQFHYATHWQFIEASEYKDQFERQPFFDTFFDAHKITDFEVAIFPMGTYPLTAVTPKGIRVIDKIMEMYEAGKKVMITGAFTMVYEYETTQNDPKVRKFFEEVLGIDYIGFRPVTDTVGTTINFLGYWGRGGIGDPVTLASRKTFNFQGALAYYYNTAVFKMKDGSDGVAMDYFIPVDEGERSDTLIGTRVENAEGGKIVYWSLGFENLSVSTGAQFSTLGAIRYMLKKAPADGPKLEFIPREVLFGSVDVNQEKIVEFVAQNAGTQTLNISEIVFSEWTDPGIYTFDGGMPKLPIVLQPNETKTFAIKFVPDDNGEFNEFIDFTTNDPNAKYVGLQLKGRGGTGVWPMIQADKSTYNFGSVEPLKQAFQDIEIKNIGVNELVVNWISIEDNDKKTFSFIQGNTTPVVLKQNETRIVRIKFVPAEEEVYRSTVKILSTSIENPELYLSLIGQGVEPGNGPQITVDQTSLNFGAVTTGESSTEELTLGNSGKQGLEISSIEFKENEGAVFSIVDAPELPLTIDSENEYKLKVSFTPNSDKEYFGKLEIVSTSETDANLEISLSGSGNPSSVWEPKAVSSDGRFSMEVLPNPVSEKAVIRIEVKRDLSASSELYLLDESGRKVSDVRRFGNGTGSYTEEFNVASLASGTYFIIAESGNSRVTLPVIVVK